MAQANPGVTLSAVTAAGAGTAVDMMGAATGVAGLKNVSVVAVVSGWAVAANTAPTANLGLEVSLDNTTWVRLADITLSGNGTYWGQENNFPFRYARATLDALSANITGITLTATVAGSA